LAPPGTIVICFLAGCLFFHGPRAARLLPFHWSHCARIELTRWRGHAAIPTMCGEGAAATPQRRPCGGGG
jgi:hypothetical protein